MSSVIVSRTPSTSTYTPDFKPASSNPSLKRSASSSNSNSSSSHSTPNSIRSGPPTSSPSDPNGKKKKKQKLRDENPVRVVDGKQKQNQNQKEPQASASSSPTDSTTSEDSEKNTNDRQSKKTFAPASSHTLEQQSARERNSKGKEPLVKSLVNPNSNPDLLNPNNSSIAALLEDPIRFHSTKSNLNVVPYKPINDPDYVSEFGSKKAKGKERQIEDESGDEEGEDVKADQTSTSSAVASTSNSKLPKSSSSSSIMSSNGNQESNSQNSSPSKSQPTKQLYLYPISERFPPSMPRKVGRGMNNSGNTCYLNSTLQALVHTPPLLSSLLTRKPAELTDIYSITNKTPDPSKFRALDALQKIARKAMQPGGGGGSFWPGEIADNLKQFAKPLRKGRQEDAHEFLRFLLEAMQQQCMGFLKASSASPLPSTTLPYKIFGGKLRSRVHCLNCKANSDTFETFLDLSLDINGKIFSLDDALRGFNRVDRLEGSEKYKCEKCKKKVNARKQFTIDSLPPILTIHLKRFTLTGGKLNKMIDFRENIDLSDCLSPEKRRTEPLPKYRLYAVVHHLGSSPNSGHYISTVRDVDGKWKSMDDSFVSSASSPVGDRSAYMLFYQRVSQGKLNSVISASTSSNVTKNPFTNSNPSPNSSFNANASSSKLHQSQSNGNLNQQKKRKLIDDDEDIGQAESRVQRSNPSTTSSKLVNKLVEIPLSRNAFSSTPNSTPSVPAASFYNGTKKNVKNPLDSIEDFNPSSRSHLDQDFGGDQDDDDDDDETAGSYQKLYSSNQNGPLSKAQNRKMKKKEWKKKSSIHGKDGELAKVKGFHIGGNGYVAGLDTLKTGAGKFNQNGSQAFKGSKKNGKPKLDFASKMKRRS